MPAPHHSPRPGHGRARGAEGSRSQAQWVYEKQPRRDGDPAGSVPQEPSGGPGGAGGSPGTPRKRNLRMQTASAMSMAPSSLTSEDSRHRGASPDRNRKPRTVSASARPVPPRNRSCPGGRTRQEPRCRYSPGSPASRCLRHHRPRWGECGLEVHLQRRSHDRSRRRALPSDRLAALPERGQGHRRVPRERRDRGVRVRPRVERRDEHRVRRRLPCLQRPGLPCGSFPACQ